MRAAAAAARGPRVIGIDPGLAATGWAVLEAGWSKPRVVACGTIRTAAGDGAGARLVKIARGLRAAIAEHAPGAAAVEEALVARSARSALALGEALGVALLAAADAGLEIHQYLPMHVKQAATGYGHAEKGQVERMLPHLVDTAAGWAADSAHATDAVAIALCHLGHGSSPRRAGRRRVSPRAAWTAFAAKAGK